MAKRVPVDCRRLTEDHLSGLTYDELMLIAERIETQTMQLCRARRLVTRAADRQREPAPR